MCLNSQVVRLEEQMQGHSIVSSSLLISILIMVIIIFRIHIIVMIKIIIRKYQRHPIVIIAIAIVNVIIIVIVILIVKTLQNYADLKHVYHNVNYHHNHLQEDGDVLPFRHQVPRL